MLVRQGRERKPLFLSFISSPLVPPPFPLGPFSVGALSSFPSSSLSPQFSACMTHHFPFPPLSFSPFPPPRPPSLTVGRLLEVNQSPSLGLATQTDREVKIPLLSHLLQRLCHPVPGMQSGDVRVCVCQCCVVGRRVCVFLPTYEKRTCALQFHSLSKYGGGGLTSRTFLILKTQRT